MPEHHTAYLLRRADVEEEKARLAREPGVAAIHNRMASEYRQRAAECGVAPVAP